MGNQNYIQMLTQINNKLGFDIREYNNMDTRTEFHEQDNIENPLACLSMEELLFIRENNYFLK